MTILNFFRILKWGIKSFWRNGWMSAGTIGIMVLNLLLVTGILIFNVMSKAAFAEVHKKIDISVYFKPESQENQILKVRSQLLSLPEVSEVSYVTKEEALESFKERHKESKVILESLNELGSNPLEASLNIKAKDSNQYAKISTFLETSSLRDIFSKVSFRENQAAIERLTNIISALEKGALALSVALGILAVIVTFNTIRLTMQTWRDEIQVMRLVGAGNWYIRGPFLLEGILYGVFSSVLTLLFFYPVMKFLSPKVNSFLPGTNLLFYWQQNLGEIFLILLAVGVVLGYISSAIAINKYLKI